MRFETPALRYRPVRTTDNIGGFTESFPDQPITLYLDVTLHENKLRCFCDSMEDVIPGDVIVLSDEQIPWTSQADKGAHYRVRESLVAGRHLVRELVIERMTRPIVPSDTGFAAPVITSAAAATVTATVGAPFVYQIAATNLPNSYAVTNLPAGLSLNTLTGLITGAPTASGTSQFTITASNVAGSDSLVVTLTAAALPIITSAAAVTATVGAPFVYQIAATNSPTSFAAANLPDGLVLNTSTGAITGSPTAAGQMQFTVSATNAQATGSLVVTLTSAAIWTDSTGGTPIRDEGNQ